MLRVMTMASTTICVTAETSEQMLATLARAAARLAPRASALGAAPSRSMCVSQGLQVDNVCRVLSCKVSQR